MDDPLKITKEENAIADLLGEAFNRFSKLPVVHDHDLPEFVLAIHSAQNIILARSAMRQNGYRTQKKKGN